MSTSWNGVCKGKKLVKCGDNIIDCGGDRYITEWINPTAYASYQIVKESIPLAKRWQQEYTIYGYPLEHHLIYAIWGWVNKNISYKYDDRYPDYWNDVGETYSDRWGDCLFPDTPLIVLKGNMPDLVEVSDLVLPSLGVGQKQYFDNLYLLCGHHKGYTSSHIKFYPVNWIIKKTSEKPKVRIRTGKSIFDVTSDHPIMCRVGTERTFRTPLEVGDSEHFIKTDLPFKVFSDIYGSKLEDELAYDLGWLYGFFVAEGSSGRGWWKIRNTNEALLERTKKIIEECCDRRVHASDFFRSLSFEIIEEDKEGEVTNFGIRTKPLKSLVARAKQDGKGSAKARGSLLKFSGVWRERFYTTEGRKKVPTIVLNGNKKMVRGFLDGFNAGDAGTTTSKILAFGLVILYNKIGVDARIHDSMKNMEIRLVDGKSENKTISRHVKVLDSGGEARIVYDLNVPSPHVFVAGDIFVHNCEDSAIACASAVENFMRDNSKVKLAIGYVIMGGQLYGHAWCYYDSSVFNKRVVLECTYDDYVPPTTYIEGVGYHPTVVVSSREWQVVCNCTWCQEMLNYLRGDALREKMNWKRVEIRPEFKEARRLTWYERLRNKVF